MWNILRIASYLKSNPMDKQKILHADYLDIVFDNRNKIYGGYELRKKYPARAKRAILGVLLSTGIICAVPVIASNLGKKPGIPLPGNIETPIVTTAYNVPKQQKPASKQTPPPVKQPAIKEPPAVASTKAFTPPRIVDNDKVEHETPPVDALKDKMIGTKDSDGDPNGKVADIGQKHGTGDGFDQPHDNTGDPKDEIVEMPDEMPSFNGDVYGYLSTHITYPEAAREAGAEGRVYIQFVVSESGKITDVEVIRGIDKRLDNEAVRVVSAMPAWKPGKVKGKAVKTYYKLPITFQLG